MSRPLLTTLVTCLWVSAASGQTTIGFDSVGQRVSVAGYAEGGIVFGDQSRFAATVAPDAGGIPSNCTPFLSSCGICIPSLEAEHGGLFDLLDVALGEFLFFGTGPFPTRVTITGVKKDGSRAQLDVTTDGIVGFEPFGLDERFTDLVSARFQTASLYTAIAIDDIRVNVGLDKPALTISPPSGLYTTTQAFDLTLIVAGASSGAILNATLDGEDFTAELAACAVEGQLESVPGLTFRCSIDPGEGTHILSASIESLDGARTEDSVTWDVLSSSEP